MCGICPPTNVAKEFYQETTNNSKTWINDFGFGGQTRSSWLNCALRDDEAVYWVSIGHYEAVAVGN